MPIETQSFGKFLARSRVSKSTDHGTERIGTEFEDKPMRMKKFHSIMLGVLHAFGMLLEYYRALWYFTVSVRSSYVGCPYFVNNRNAKAYVYSLTLALFLWNKPHYRNLSFQEDLRKNLRNVCIPGTGLPLSFFCIHKYLAFYFLFVLYPIISFFSTFVNYSVLPSNGQTFWEMLETQLLTPEDWFSLWQLNCRLSSYHSYVTKSKSYTLENKWEFLKMGSALNPPTAVSPWIKDVGSIVVKDRNEEGGMGVYIYQNAASGGDWIIQEKLENAQSIAKMLPIPSPLSTFRIMTSSSVWLDGNDASEHRSIDVLSCVFRAGLQGAKTDHEAILFDVDLWSGQIGLGTSNSHWYELGFSAPLKLLTSCSLKSLTSTHDIRKHHQTGFEITDEVLDSKLVKTMQKVVMDAHFRMLPDVPVVGWDVAVTDKGVCLLEANLSCNFFRGSFDREKYFQLIDRFFVALEQRSH